jgi:hypothetical protein
VDTPDESPARLFEEQYLETLAHVNKHKEQYAATE